MKQLNPSFSTAIQAAGLMGLPFTWSPDGTINFDPSMTPQQIAAVEAVYAAYDPDAVSWAQTAQIAMLSAACSAAIYAGFSSSALGTAHSYPFGDLDQTNLNGDVSLSMLQTAQVAGWTTPFWCADSTGAWDMRAHTAAQIQQVGTDAAAAKLAQVSKNITLAAQVMQAATVAAVQAIVWG